MTYSVIGIIISVFYAAPVNPVHTRSVRSPSEAFWLDLIDSSFLGNVIAPSTSAAMFRQYLSTSCDPRRGLTYDRRPSSLRVNLSVTKLAAAVHTQQSMYGAPMNEASRRFVLRCGHSCCCCNGIWHRTSPSQPDFPPWAGRRAAWLHNKFHKRKDTNLTPYEKVHLNRYNNTLLIFSEKVAYAVDLDAT